jgi:hypothetical protein
MDSKVTAAVLDLIEHAVPQGSESQPIGFESSYDRDSHCRPSICVYEHIPGLRHLLR